MRQVCFVFLFQIWQNDVLLKSTRSHEGSVFSVTTNGKWLFSGGWDKKIIVQEVAEAADGTDVVSLGTISSNSPVTALLYWHGKLFVGEADRIKVLLVNCYHQLLHKLYFSFPEFVLNLHICS